MAARLKTDEEAWLGQPPSPFVLPMLLGAALLSAALVLYAAGNGVLAAGFAASVIAIAGLMRWYRHLYAPALSDREATPDWTVARAAADASNIAIAVVPKVVRKGIFYISPNAGPSYLAGKNCHKNYFNASWQNDNLPEAMGQYLQKKGLKRVYLISVNYPAGKDMVKGFRRFYKGQPTAEVYAKLGQKDYAAEIAAVRNANPEAVFFFLPGGMGISFLKQWGQAGLTGKIALYGPGFSFDQTILKAASKAALGVINSTQWNKDLPNAANKRFVADFKKKFGRLPSLFASQGYDTARLIASAIQAVGGDLSRKDDFREALRKADFEAVRGNFKFSANHHPIHDIYIRIVVEENGVITNKTIGKGMAMRSNAYIDQCKMK